MKTGEVVLISVGVGAVVLVGGFLAFKSMKKPRSTTTQQDKPPATAPGNTAKTSEVAGDINAIANLLGAGAKAWEASGLGRPDDLTSGRN